MTLLMQADQVQASLVRRVVENLNIRGEDISYIVVKAGLTIGSDDGSVIMQLSSDHTVTMPIDLDTGSEAPNTWYYVWMIRNPATEAVDFKFSTSPTNPVMPSGFTQKRLISAVRNNSSSDFFIYKQHGFDVFYWIEANLLGSWSGTTAWQTLDFSSFVPVAMSRKILIEGHCHSQDTNASQSLFYAPEGSPSPGVLLIHTRNTSNEAYHTSQFTILLSDAGTAQFYTTPAGGTYGGYVYVTGFTLDL